MQHWVLLELVLIWVLSKVLGNVIMGVLSKILVLVIRVLPGWSTCYSYIYPIIVFIIQVLWSGTLPNPDSMLTHGRQLWIDTLRRETHGEAQNPDGGDEYSDISTNWPELRQATLAKAVFTLHPVRVLDSSEPFVSGRLSVVGFCSHHQLLTRRERYAYLSPCTHCVCFATLLVTQLLVLNLWHILRFPGHVLIVSHVALVLTKETSGNILLIYVN